MGRHPAPRLAQSGGIAPTLAPWREVDVGRHDAIAKHALGAGLSHCVFSKRMPQDKSLARTWCAVRIVRMNYTASKTTNHLK